MNTHLKLQMLVNSLIKLADKQQYFLQKSLTNVTYLGPLIFLENLENLRFKFP